MSRQGQSKTLEFLQRLFRTYYSKATLYFPRDLDKREFAFQPLGKDTYVRHITFSSESEARKYLVENTPANAYYSSALFLFPHIKDMEQKGWIGSEILFDIDADALPGCRGTAKSVCLSCGFTYPGMRECPRCGSKSVVEAESVEEKCLEKAAEQTSRLVDVLKRDFGFNDVTVTFTGNRGFHVRVSCSSECMKMSSEERRELVAYIKGVGLEPSLLQIPRGRGEKSKYVPHPADGGWRGRIGWVLYNRYGLDPNKRYTVKELQDMGVDYDPDALIKEAAIEIDEKVTIDIHRLERIPGSLHGKTGLPSLILSTEELSKFRISCDISPFKGKATVIPVVDLPEVKVFEEYLSLRKGEPVALNHCQAVFLLLRNLATVA